MRYNKEFVKSDGRKLSGGGPRDIQRRQAMSDIQDTLANKDAIIEVLKSEINNLKDELSNHSNVRGVDKFTAEEFDEELNKVVSSTIKEMELKFSVEIEKLKSIIESKDVLISELKKIKSTSEIMEEDKNRPVMEDIFIDPLEKDAGKGLESHIKIKDETTDDVKDKAKKLNNLFGGKKLPLGK